MTGGCIVCVGYTTKCWLFFLWLCDKMAPLPETKHPKYFPVKLCISDRLLVIQYYKCIFLKHVLFFLFSSHCPNKTNIFWPSEGLNYCLKYQIYKMGRRLKLLDNLSSVENKIPITYSCIDFLILCFGLHTKYKHIFHFRKEWNVWEEAGRLLQKCCCLTLSH